MTELLSIVAAAKELSISPWTIRAHMREGSITPVRCGRRVLITRAELDRIVREGLPSLSAKKPDGNRTAS